MEKITPDQDPDSSNETIETIEIVTNPGVGVIGEQHVQSLPPDDAPSDRVPVSQKIGYGLGSFIDMWGHWLYPTIAFQIFGLYLHVPQWQIGVAIILNRVFDAISDPFFGWLSDNTRSRWGRRRPFMLIGCLLAGIGLPFLLAASPSWSPSTCFWFMLASSALYLPLVGCFNMPYMSLGNEMTPDYHERTSVFSYKNAVQKIPELGLFFFGNFFSRAAWVGADSSNVFQRIKLLLTTTDAWHSAADGTKPNLLLGAQVYLVFCGLIIIVVGLTCVDAWSGNGITRSWSRKSSSTFRSRKRSGRP